MSWGRFVAELAAAGTIPPQWQPAFAAVPRAPFVPDRALAGGDHVDPAPINRERDPRAWETAVNGDRWIITQWDDGAAPADEPGTLATSSCSMPGIVAEMLSALDVQDGQRVLEIGTGTGWNAALLCHRLGEANVTTVEIDAVLAERARQALAGAGWHPQVVTADGEQGHPPGAPYDRIIATCSVTRVPYAWVAQLAPAGKLVTPWRGWFAHGGLLLALHPRGDGTSAVGRFQGRAAFMASRRQRMPTVEVDPTGAGASSTTTLHPDMVTTDPDAEVAVGVVLEPCQWWRLDLDDGGHVFNLDDVDSGSWAQVGPLGPAPAAGYAVRQAGPRQLWDELETAYGWWVAHGCPGWDRFGITVTPQGQHMWLDHPGQPVSGVQPGSPGRC